MTPGWIERDGARVRLFREEANGIVLALKRMQPKKDGLLGNSVATRMLVDWVPDRQNRRCQATVCGPTQSPETALKTLTRARVTRTSIHRTKT